MFLYVPSVSMRVALPQDLSPSYKSRGGFCISWTRKSVRSSAGYFRAVDILTAQVFSILINLKLCNVLVMHKHIYIYIFASMKGMLEASWILLGLSEYVFFWLVELSGWFFGCSFLTHPAFLKNTNFWAWKVLEHGPWTLWSGFGGVAFCWALRLEVCFLEGDESVMAVFSAKTQPKKGNLDGWKEVLRTWLCWKIRKLVDKIEIYRYICTQYTYTSFKKRWRGCACHISVSPEGKHPLLMLNFFP